MQTRSVYLMFILITTLLITGCMGGERIQVEIPPQIPTDDIKTIAILEFSNEAQDPGLAREMENILMDYFRDHGRYTVIDRHRFLQSFHHQDILTPHRARDLGSQIGADAFIIASVTYYFEDIVVDPPRRHGSLERSYWTTQQTTTVQTRLVARVVDARSGRIIYTKTSEGEGRTRQHISFPDWPGDYSEPPPPQLIPRRNRSDIPKTRKAAIEDAILPFAADFYPTYRYVRVDQ